MILPTKGISPESALLTVGGRVLATLDAPKTVSRVWEEVRAGLGTQPSLTFDWFVLALDALFAMGLVELRKGRLHRLAAQRESSS